jgi:GMP synthase (glutamine-hydrolysing)
MQILVLQHVPFEGPATLANWALSRGVQLNIQAMDQRHNMPELWLFDGIIVLGGPMGVYDDDEHPWLSLEKKFLATARQASKPILGICLGAQLLAQLEGATVRNNKYKEIGWWPIHFTQFALQSPLFEGFPAQLEVMHWHGDSFDLPATSQLLASTPGCQNQGFLSHDGKLLGLQFHMEWNFEVAQALVTHCRHELEQQSPYVQTKEEILRPSEAYAAMNTWMYKLMDRFFVCC